MRLRLRMPAALALAAFPALAPAALPALAAADATPHAGAPIAPPSPRLARLQGSFLLAGLVTVAVRVSGEHRGETVLRTWTFASRCPSGPCATVGLLRARGRAQDALVLHRSAPGYYVGTGAFSAPLQCGQRVYRNGALVPFTITVRITAAGMLNGTVLATRVQATYTNRERVNLTPCVGVLGHDAATYHGHLLLPPAAGT